MPDRRIKGDSKSKELVPLRCVPRKTFLELPLILPDDMSKIKSAIPAQTKDGVPPCKICVQNQNRIKIQSVAVCLHSG